MDVISLSNQKGGTGKTATTFALSEVLNGAHGQNVLMIDLDPQSSLTFAAGVEPKVTMGEVLLGEASPELHELREGLYLLPSSIELSDARMTLASRKGRTKRLKGVLDKIRGIDTVVIDCPPSLSLLTVNALAASDYVIIPTRATVMDIEGMHLLTDTVEAVKENLNPGLEVMGVLVTFYDPRLLHSKEVLDRLEGMDLRLFDTRIGQSVRVAEAREKSVVRYAPRNKRAQEYIRFGKEVYQWLNRQ